MKESLSELLADLHGVVEPGPVAYVPQTPGWFVLVALLLAAVAYGAWQWRNHRQSNAYRRAALREVDRIEQRLHAGDQSALAELAALPRRVALHVWERTEITPLDGDAWLEFLGRHGPGVDFRSPPGRLLVSIAYATPAELDKVSPGALALVALVRRWIKVHRA